tara:strand:- start:189 stop:1850 length:1662 start_codon:yes stop_codon:yes gene_type:complete
MSTIKISELATGTVSSESLLAFADVNGLASKGTIKQVIGNYVVNSLLDFDSLILNASTGVWMVISDITLDANKTIPAGVTLQFRDAKINLGGFTLTGTSTKIDTGLTQIFDTSGNITGEWVINDFYPQWFGALGDGVTDDTSSLQATMDVITSQIVSRVKIPKGVYNHTGITLNFTTYADSFRIIGDNPKETVLNNTGSGDGFLIGGTIGLESTWGKVEGISFKQTGNGLNGIKCVGVGRLQFVEVWSSGHGQSGFHYTNSWSPSFIRCRADNNGDYGAYLEGGINHDINGAYFEGGAYSSNTLDGVYILGATDDDTISGEFVNVGFSNNIRNGVWCKTPGLTFIGCFFEFNQNCGVKIGDISDERSVFGIQLLGCFFDGRNIGGLNYSTVIIEEANGVSFNGCNFKETDSCIEVDASSINITVGSVAVCRRATGSTTNIVDLNGNLFTDNSKSLLLRAESVQVGTNLLNTIQVESGQSGYRLDVTGNGAVSSSALVRLLKDNNVIAGIRNDGRLILDGAISTAGTPTTIQNKIEIFDASGTSLGWIPIWANF